MPDEIHAWIMTADLGGYYSAYTRSMRYVAYGNSEEAAVAALLALLPSRDAIYELPGRRVFPPPPNRLRNDVPVPSSTRLQVYARDGYRCVQCGSSTKLTIDHIIPRAAGGSNDPVNLQTLCLACNGAKADTYEEITNAKDDP